MKALILFTLIVFSCAINAQKVLIGSKFNEVGNELNMLVLDKYGMTEKKSEMKDGIMNIHYIPKVVTGKEQAVSIHYVIAPEGTISKIEIRGTLKEVSNLFSDYWKTKAAYNVKPGIVAEKKFISDIVRFRREKSNNSAFITVTSS